MKKFNLIYINMPNKNIFSVKNNNNQMYLNVDETLYTNSQSSTPSQQKKVQDLMTLKFIQESHL